MRRLLVRMGGAVAVLAAVLAVRTVRFSGQQVLPPAEPLALDSARVVARFAAALRIPTVSEEDSAKRDPEQLVALHRLLDDGFPRVHTELSRETVGQYSLLYTWPGSDTALPAVLLTSHQDV